MCPVCSVPCTQLPSVDRVISGVLSITYKLQEMKEPTFTSLGLDPNLFVRFFQTFEQPPEDHLGHDQRQFEEVQETGPTHGQDDGNGVVSDQIDQQAQHDESGVTSGAVAVWGVGDMMGSGGATTVEPSGEVTVVPEDIDMT